MIPDRKTRVGMEGGASGRQDGSREKVVRSAYGVTFLAVLTLLHSACNMFTPDISGEWELNAHEIINGVQTNLGGETISFIPSLKEGPSRGVFVPGDGFQMYVRPIIYEVKRDRIIFHDARGNFPATWEIKVSGEWMTVTTELVGVRNSVSYHRIKTLQELDPSPRTH